MTNEPPISVVVPYSPAHTPKKMLDRAIDSVEAQTLDVHPIVVTEGDNVAEGRNIGLNQASSRYVAFLDADDYWKPNKLARQYDIMQNCNCALCLTTTVRSDGTYNDVTASSDFEFVQKLVIGNLSNITSSILIDTEKTRARFDESLYRFEDYLFVLEAVNDGGYCYVDEPLTCLEKHEHGLTANEEFNRKLDSHYQFYEQATNLFPELLQFSDEYWSQVWYNSGRVHYDKNDYRSSISFLWNSFLEKPRIKTAAALGLSSIKYVISEAV
jgi:glycosyltransferase involved in cell wall biosynthesis